MFRRITNILGFPVQDLVELHPAQLTGLLEIAWNFRKHPPPPNPTGHPDHRSDVPGLAIANLPGAVLDPTSLGTNAATLASTIRFLQPGLRWDHLIYAYMIENTRIFEIFRRVVQQFVHGDRSPGSAGTMRWLRNTEELFFRDQPPFSITTLTSYIRPDRGSIRRNAYQRMFGMELNHGKDDNSPYPYVRAKAANNDFVTTFEELLRESWVGYVHRTTTTANPTDDSKIADLANSLHDMLRERRISGNLSREEFVAVSTMSWFHLTIDNDLPLFDDLGINESTPEQRLFEVAKLVGLPAHKYSRSYFLVAETISQVLAGIETGLFNTVATARNFYDPTLGSLADQMNTINTYWSKFSGRDMKARKVASDQIQVNNNEPTKRPSKTLARANGS